jgi:hypothetical protein
LHFSKEIIRDHQHGDRDLVSIADGGPQLVYPRA